MGAQIHDGTLAMHGGEPVRKTLLPYGRHTIDENDIAAVVEVLKSDWITQGPKVDEFEATVASLVGAKHAVAFNSGTAALHGAAYAADLGPGDEAITTPLTFCATSNSVLYTGARPVFSDVRDDTLNIDSSAVLELVGPRTKALLPVDYGGHPADLEELAETAQGKHILLIEDACHALGASYHDRRVGSIADMTTFSFHPVKHVAVGEGGMVTTDSVGLARRLRLFRNHGIDFDPRTRELQGSWLYQMVELGYNFRLTDMGCALGLSQVSKLGSFLARRRLIARSYLERLRGIRGLRLPAVLPRMEPAWHLFPVRLQEGAFRAPRAEIYKALRMEGIGVNVHYIPVPWHPYYQKLGFRKGAWPVAESAYEQLLSLPMWPGMTDQDVSDVVAAMTKVLTHFGVGTEA